MAEPVTALGHGTMLVPAQAVLKMLQLKKYRTFEALGGTYIVEKSRKLNGK